MQTLQIYGDISYYDAAYLVSQLNQLAALEDEITICIDSPGGSPFAAMSLYTAIKNLQAHGKKVIARVEFLCASAAAMIASACDTVQMNSMGLYMIHNVGMFVQSDADQALLNKFNAIMLELNVKRTGKTEDEVKAMLADDFWMTAEEAKTNGFIDEIFELEPSETIVAKFEQLNGINKNKNRYELVAQLYSDKNKTTVNMLEKVNAVLKLDSKSNEETIVASILNLTEQSTKMTAEVERKDLIIHELNSKIKSYEDQVKAAVEKQAVELVNEAVKANRITLASKDKWLAFAIADLDGTKEILASFTQNTGSQLNKWVNSGEKPIETQITNEFQITSFKKSLNDVQKISNER